MTAVTVRDAYRRWAPTYSAETALSLLEDDAVRALTPPLAGLRLLDAGCGVGRRLRGTDAALAVGVDVSEAMIAVGRRQALPPNVRLSVGDMRALDLPDRAFDVLWCRLAIGHLPDCRPVYRELARVAGKGAMLIVSDFHPDAWAAGHRRTFRDAGELVEVEHHVHSVEDHRAAAAAAGFQFRARRDGAVGERVRPFYEAAGRADLYDDQLGLPLALVLAFRRAG